MRVDGCPAGFTVLELLTVIAVLGLLLSLLLPAVQSSSAAARRVECSARLKEIGVAMQNHESVHKTYPGFFHYPLLPFLGQEVYQKSLHELGSTDPPAGMIPTWYLCPSDPAEAGPNSTNYGPNVGLSYYGYNGFFYRRSWNTKPADVIDGLSNTVCLTELLRGTLAEPPRLRVTWYTTARFGENELDALANYAEAIPPNPTDYGYFAEPRGRDWRNTNSIWGNHAVTPNRPSVQPESSHGAFTAVSMHRGGVHALYGDGHVAFASQDIERTVWRELGSRSRDLEN